MRVAITGLGCITPIGNSVADFREAMYAGQSGIAEFDRMFPGAVGTDAGVKFRTIARVKGFDPEQHFTTGIIGATDLSAQFGIAAARQALAESRLLDHYDRTAVAIVTGCACGGRAADEEAARHLYTRDARVPPATIIRTMASSGSSFMAMDMGVTGPVLNLSTACASGTHAIGLACHMVRSGMAQAAVAGGYEAPLTFGFLRAWDSMRVVSPTSCRPFSADRDGMTLGEGAAMLVIEPMETALARGVRVYAELVGFGMSADAQHITQPQAEGAALAMRRALEDAEQSGIERAASRVGYINAHGTGTQTNDAVEAAAIHQALGEFAPSIPVGATKSLTGHSIGAAGAVEALATVLALDYGSLPFTAGVQEIDRSLDLDVIVNESRTMDPLRDLALSNSLAFGGLNAVLAVRRFHGPSPAIP